MRKIWRFLFALAITAFTLSAVSTPQKTVKQPLANLTVKMPQADLVITNCRFEPQGTKILARATLLNSGNAGATFQVGQAMAELSILGKSYMRTAPAGGYYLGGSQSAELSQELSSVPPGTYPATWTANPTGVITEKNTGNNSANCQLAIAPSQGPLPDLVITNLSVQPASGPPSTVFTIMITITNQGDALVHGNANIYANLILDGWGFDPPICGVNPGYVDLAPGQSMTYSRCTTNPLAPGTHQISASIDTTNKIVEKIESNNGRSCTFTVTQ